MHAQPMTEDLVSYFKKVSDFRTNITQLQHAWDSLALLAQLSGTGSEMELTRSAFNQISNHVLQHLSNETLNKTAAQLSSKAQVIHNKFNPNLFLQYGTDTREYATFYVGNTWMGIETQYVLEASDEVQLRTLPEAAAFIAGIHPYRNEVIPVVDLARMLGNPGYQTDHRQIVVIQDKAHGLKFGVFVSALGEIPYLSPTQIQPMQSLFRGRSHNPGVAIANIGQGNDSPSMLTLVTALSLWEKAIAAKPAQQVAQAML